MRRQALLILACPRSGATALAAALAHAGAHAGRTFVAPSAGEASATWQCAPLAELNERLLSALGLRWDSLVAPPERWRERASVRSLAPEADALLATEYGVAPKVLLHDPRLALTLPFWRERLESAGYDMSAVQVVRRPTEVAASLAKREAFAPEKSLALWLHYVSEAERGTRGLPRVLVSYDRLLDAPAGVLSHVVSSARFPLRIERAEREAALTAIRPDLKHCGESRNGAASALSSGMDRVLEDGYAKLAQLSPGVDPRATIEAINQAAYAPLLHAIPPWLAQELARDRLQAEQLADALHEAGVRLAELDAEHGEARRAHAEREQTEAMLRARIETMSRPGSSEGRAVRVDEALARLKGDVARIAETLADQPSREQALRIEISQLQRDLGDERQTISRLSDELETERAAHEAHAAALATAQTQLEALASELERARASQAIWTEHGEALARDVDEARIALSAMQSERDSIRKERDESTRQLAQLKSELESARTDLRILDHDRNALAARAQAVGDAAGALREELARRSKAEATLAAERDRLAAQLREQSDRLAQLEREIERRVLDLTALSARHEALSKVLAALERSWLGRRALVGVRRSGA